MLRGRLASVWAEAAPVTLLALPACATNGFAVLLQLVDASFVGHIGARELAAASLANAYFSMLWYFMLGVATALDTFASQAHGAGKPAAAVEWAVTASVVMLLLCVPGAGMLYASGWVIRHAFGQSAAVAALSGRFCTGLIPGLPFLALSTTLQKYQQSCGRMVPSVVAGALTNVANGLFNVAFIYTLGFGFDGSPLATSASRLVGLLLLAALEARHACPPALRSALAVPTTYCSRRRLTALGTFLALGLPGGVMLALEAWAFEVVTVCAGLLGQTSVDAHTVMLSVASFTFLSFPFGIATAASVHVGQLCGASQPWRARDAAAASLLLGVGSMACFACLIYLSREYVAALFTTDSDVAALVVHLAPVCALFQVLDGFQGVSGGILRGLGYQPTIALLNLLSFWVIAAPVGALLAFWGRVGVVALWWGLAIGLAAGCVSYSVLLCRIDWQHEAQKAQLRAASITTAPSAAAADAATPFQKQDLSQPLLPAALPQ